MSSHFQRNSPVNTTRSEKMSSKVSKGKRESDFYNCTHRSGNMSKKSRQSDPDTVHIAHLSP